MAKELDKAKVLLPVGILIGAVVGAVSGVLLAPKSGKENREKVKEVAKKLENELAEKLKSLKAVTKEDYIKAVDTIVAEYSKKEPVIKKHISELKKTLKERFKS